MPLPRHVHLVGIGGAGMAGLAHYLLGTGRVVSGSDTAASPVLHRLAAAGARVAHTHAASNLSGAGAVVVSDAIPADNVEMEAARASGIVVLRRAECLDRLAEGRTALLVAGSHGKSTTTAMIACVLATAGLDPGFVIGADVPCLGDVRARAGGGPLFAAEACEAFRNLEHLRPGIAVITNIDDEHVNHYASQVALDDAFAAFAQRAGTVVVSGEDPGVARIRGRLGRVTTFGLHPGCDVSARPGSGRFTVLVNGRVAGTIAIRLPGDHVRRNALAAAAACLQAGVSFDAVANGLAAFTGVARRWQEAGSAAGVRIIDDYAHHPAEIAATLRTARQMAPGARLVAAFQPLLHSRVNRLSQAFAKSLGLADHVLLLDVDGGGEAGGSVGSAGIAEALRRDGVPVDFRGAPDDLVEAAHADLRSGDLLIVMGGGRIEGVAGRLLRRLNDVKTEDRVSRRAWSSRLTDIVRRPSSVVDLIRARARSGPGHPALMAGADTMSYAALDAASDTVAAGLAARGIDGRAVGVCLPQSLDLVVALLGIMKAGGIYLPLDPALPDARRRFMLERADAAALIAQETAAPGLPSLSVAALRSEPGQVPPGPRGGGDAYICFTSGSTGEPKGIRITHAALFAMLRDTVPRFGIGAGTRMALNTSISFDVSLAEICGTLAGGGALVVGGTRPLVGERLGAFLADRAITHLSVTPSVLASVTPRPLPALGCIIACGEALAPALVDSWAPGRCLWNVYGPTETTIYATAAQCRANEPVTIGIAMAHVRAHVMDESLRPVPAGALGEICLSGPGVSAGYIDDAAATAGRFSKTRHGRVYRTGDLARIGPDGAIRFIGRADDQIKIMGNRIELGEIERAALRDPAVSSAAVCVAPGNSSSLICFVVAKLGSVIDRDALLAGFAAWLPDSAVPAHIVQVETIPLTPSGKTDRRRLLAEHRGKVIARASDFVAPRTDTEIRLASLWQAVLNLDDRVGMFDRFAGLGGDSLAALMLIADVETAFGVTVPPGYFGRLSTVPQMAVLLADLIWHGTGPSVSTGFRGSRMYRQLRDLSGHWAGTRADGDSLIATLGTLTAAHDLFLCCQEEVEFLALARHMPPEFRVHAMRSGHLVIDHGPDGLRQLCGHFADEIERIDPPGTVILAGICQGGTIASVIAETLSARGRPIEMLALIEQGRPHPYAGPVALFYAEDSFLNPLRPGGIGRAQLETAFADGYTIDLMPGGHCGVCVEPGVPFLAHHLVRRVSQLAAHAEAGI